MYFFLLVHLSIPVLSSGVLTSASCTVRSSSVWSKAAGLPHQMLAHIRFLIFLSQCFRLARKLTDADGTQETVKSQKSLLKRNGPIVQYLQKISQRFDLHNRIFVDKSNHDRRDIFCDYCHIYTNIFFFFYLFFCSNKEYNRSSSFRSGPGFMISFNHRVRGICPGHRLPMIFWVFSVRGINFPVHASFLYPVSDGC
jgi:hypothetical protein